MASGKRCHYEVLGLARDCKPDEIRSAYKKLALQLHPDKLIQSGLSQAEATAKFQELSHAYEVLSDSKERSWYDSHRSQILFSDPDAARDSVVPNLFSFFSNAVYSGYGDAGKGFYKVYSDVFDRVYASEVRFARTLGSGLEKLREAPVMGNLDSPYDQVTAFYNYWLGFATIMDFCWADMYDAASGVNRKSRRVMEDENVKLRKKARREYNETVRGLAEFVKKRDKRVIDMMIKRNQEEERRKEEEKQRKRRVEKERIERAREYVEPEWATVEDDNNSADEEVMDGNTNKDEQMEELYCVACGKKFKTEKQWQNHEQSKKHKEKVALLRRSFHIEDEDDKAELNDFHEDTEEGKDNGANHDLEETEVRFRETFTLQEEEDSGVGEPESNDEAEAEISKGNATSDESITGNLNGDEEDDDANMLESWIESRKARSLHDENDDTGVNEADEKSMNAENGTHCEINKRKKRRNRKERSGKTDKEHEDRKESQNLRTNKDRKSVNQSGENTKPDANSRSKSSSKGKRGKATPKEPSNYCQTCGEEFESRNKLHQHLGDSGHATLKYK